MKVYTVLGSSGRVGSTLVRRLCEAGHTVIGGDIIPPPVSSDFGGKFLFQKFDIMQNDSLQDIATFIEGEFGYVSHLVSCIGGRHLDERRDWEKIPPEILQHSIDYNLTRQIQMVQRFYPLMRAGSGDRSATLLSSINGIRGYGFHAYSAAKAGILGFIRSIATEFGRDGIRINSLLPGTIVPSETPLDQHRLEPYFPQSVLGRLVTPDEIAAAAEALTMLTCVTGQCWVADCGQSINAVASRRQE